MPVAAQTLSLSQQLEQARLSSEGEEQGDMAEQKQGCLQNKPPNSRKVFGRYQLRLLSCYQHALSLLSLLFNCFRSFMLW